MEMQILMVFWVFCFASFDAFTNKLESAQQDGAVSMREL